MLAMFMAAVEVTIVATAMPDIIASLGGFPLLSWVFSIYLLLQAISIPIYGRLADMFGRKPVFFVGTGLFLSGSILCGFASHMPALILFRALQGLGAGAIVPLATTIIADVYNQQERARLQGYLSSVWAVSAIIGPLMGAFIVRHYPVAGVDDFLRVVFAVPHHLTAGAIRLIVRYNFQRETGFGYAVGNDLSGDVRFYVFARGLRAERHEQGQRGG